MAKAKKGAGDKTETAPSRETAAVRSPTSAAEVFGEVVALMMMPASHKHLFLADLEWLVLPPIMLRQFRLWRNADKPVGFASWALLSPEVEARMMGGARRLQPAEWKSGEHAWLIDVLAPTPDFAQQMVDELKRTVFQGRPLKGLRPRKEGGGSEAVEL